MWPRVDDSASIVLPRPHQPGIENPELNAKTHSQPEPDSATEPSPDSSSNSLSNSRKNIEIAPSHESVSDTTSNSSSDPSSHPAPKSTLKPPIKSAADVEYERLCYQHMLLITRAPDPEGNDELSSETEQNMDHSVGLRATAHPFATIMDAKTDAKKKGKLRLKATVEAATADENATESGTT